MDYLKGMFKNLMLANIFWLICFIIMTSSIFFSNGYIDYGPTVGNVVLSVLSGGMTIFSTLLTKNSGKWFTELFGY